MNLNLENKLALVTASSGGIGRAIAQSLAGEGARVIINGLSEKSAGQGFLTLAGFPSPTIESLRGMHWRCRRRGNPWEAFSAV